MNASEELIQKALAAVAQYASNIDKINALHAENKALEAAWNDYVAAGRVFGVDVNALIKHDQDDQTKLIEGPDTNVRDAVVAEVKKAYPNAIKAKTIQNTLEKARGKPLHDKTVGMTLYRLSKDGIVTRKGHEWTYVEGSMD